MILSKVFPEKHHKVPWHMIFYANLTLLLALCGDNYDYSRLYHVALLFLELLCLKNCF